ncbi:hypothetical protein LIER_03574 [Lithospermum erythrorhizon]|uniref:Uncharacterized protein n=1 Tax=Lithospermum erythrorhizon TaxID=34254 RepID=A0AAV3NU30_LITER
MTLRIFPSCRNSWQKKNSDALLMVCCRLSKPYMHPLVVSIFIWTLGRYGFLELKIIGHCYDARYVLNVI